MLQHQLKERVDYASWYSGHETWDFGPGKLTSSDAMEPRSFFFNSVGRLRSGWRVLVFVLVFFAIQFVLATTVRIMYAISLRVAPGVSYNHYLEDLVFRTILVIVAVLAGLACTRWLEGLSWRAFGLWFHHKWFRDFIVGSIVGIVSLAFAAGIATAAGGLSFTLTGSDFLLKVIGTLIVTAVLFIIAALAEEALFRGYPLQTFTRARLFLFGAILTSVGFVAIHVANPNFKFGIAVVNLVIAGIWFAVAYWKTRSLWFPLGIHWAWNWTLTSVFGLPVSGITRLAPHPVLTGIDLGPTWLTGGAYGIEGGIACTIVLILSTLFIWRTRLVTATDEMLQLTSHENPSKPVVPQSVSDSP